MAEICAIESVIAVGPADHKLKSAQPAKLLLDCGKTEVTFSYQFPDISFLVRWSEEQA